MLYEAREAAKRADILLAESECDFVLLDGTTDVWWRFPTENSPSLLTDGRKYEVTVVDHEQVHLCTESEELSVYLLTEVL